MLTGHNYIVFLSGKYRGCNLPSHVLPPRNHHKPVCWCSMHRSGIPASFSCVPDVHSVFGYPAFSTGAVSAFSFPVSSLASPDTRITITSAWFSSAYLTIAPAVFFTQFCVQTFRIRPSSLCLRRTMFPLESADPSQCAVHPVFFTGMIYESSSQDSSVCPHDGTDCIGIDPQVHAADDLFFHRCFGKCYFFCIGKTQEIFMVSFLQCRGRCFFSLTSIFSDIPYPYAPDVHRTISSHGRHRFSGMLRLSFPLPHGT